MKDKLLCPFCNKPLQPTHRIEDEYFCENYDCPQTSITWIGTSSLWKAFADTKKKLDIAVDVAKEIDELLSSNRFDVKEVPLLCITQTKISMLLRCINLEQKNSTRTKGLSDARLPKFYM